MKLKNKYLINLVLFLSIIIYSSSSINDTEIDSANYIVGKQFYTKGILPDGDLVKATVQGDIDVEGDQLICETCHRKSGMGSTEGQQVVPAVAGNILFKPLQLPVSKPPEPPVYRPAYTRETLLAAIRDGVDANGDQLDPFMPRYDIDEAALDGLTTYLNTLSSVSSPGVDETTIHFATIITNSNSDEENKALLDVMNAFVQQRNVETRSESMRAKHAPWHKEWLFKPYRKWIIHAWELKGPKETWLEQLNRYYMEQPVFAVLSGYVPEGWEEVHKFCEKNILPCLFPTTMMPSLSNDSFYNMYMNKGVVHEAVALASEIIGYIKPGESVLQLFDSSSPSSVLASTSLKDSLRNQQIQVVDVDVNDALSLDSAINDINSKTYSTLSVWLNRDQTVGLLKDLNTKSANPSILLSTRFYGTSIKELPNNLHGNLSFIHSYEMPDRMKHLLIRSTGWFKAKRIYDDKAREIQANAYFSLKVAGDAIKHIRGYFYRDYFIEKIEHMIDDIPYTSIYPRIGLAPGQRFISKGYYLARIDPVKGDLVKVTDWKIPSL